MQGERKVLRDGIKAAIDGVHANVEIFTKRQVDARGLSEYINVYFDEGDISQLQLDQQTSAEILVGYHTANYISDDDLDEKGDALYAAIKAADIAPDVLRGMLPSGFSYGEESESAFTSLFLRFTVFY